MAVSLFRGRRLPPRRRPRHAGERSSASLPGARKRDLRHRSTPTIQRSASARRPRAARIAASLVDPFSNDRYHSAETRSARPGRPVMVRVVRTPRRRPPRTGGAGSRRTPAACGTLPRPLRSSPCSLFAAGAMVCGCSLSPSPNGILDCAIRAARTAGRGDLGVLDATPPGVRKHVENARPLTFPSRNMHQ